MEEQDVAKRLTELRGVRKWTEEQARFVLEACRASGEPPTAFARRWGFYGQRMSWWKERLHLTAARQPSSTTMSVPDAALAPLALTSTFVPMTLRGQAMAPLEALSGASSATAAVTVVVSPDVHIEVAALDVTSAAWVAALVRSLREVSR
jgi:hypothetical protein